MKKEEFRNKIAPNLPQKPGIYKFLDGKRDILYIGKAKNIKKRVRSYFSKQQHISPKTTLLVRKIKSVDFTIVNNEEDALLLENSLIKKHQPKYNVMFRDDKSYPFICLKNERFPRIFPTRRRKDDGSEYFGPYTSMKMVRTLVELLRKIFKIRTCHYNLSEKNVQKKKFKVCLEYHLGNCLGPCEGKQSEEDYQENIRHIRNILKGNIQTVIRYLKEIKKEYAEEYEFEKAHEIKEKLKLLHKFKSKSTVVNPKIHNIDVFSIVNTKKRAFVNYLRVVNGAIIQTQTLELKKGIEEDKGTLLTAAIIELRRRYESASKEVIVPFSIDLPIPGIQLKVPKIGDKKKLLELSAKNARYFMQQKKRPGIAKQKAKKQQALLEQVKQDLRLKHLPLHIECFDNSNIQGKTPVAGLVVFKDGRPSKRDYRHFNIKSVKGPDDFASMQEVVYRRYKRLLKKNKQLPQLIIIDGGKGQLNAACKSLTRLGILEQTDIIAIAKRLEEVFKPSDKYPLFVDKTSPTLKLIQRIRNEAHRFAISFHRQKREKASLTTELAQIKGIGPKTAKKLLRDLKSVKKIKDTPKEKLEALIGEYKGALVYKHFHAN